MRPPEVAEVRPFEVLRWRQSVSYTLSVPIAARRASSERFDEFCFLMKSIWWTGCISRMTAHAPVKLLAFREMLLIIDDTDHLLLFLLLVI